MARVSRFARANLGVCEADPRGCCRRNLGASAEEFGREVLRWTKFSGGFGPTQLSGVRIAPAPWISYAPRMHWAARISSCSHAKFGGQQACALHQKKDVRPQKLEASQRHRTDLVDGNPLFLGAWDWIFATRPRNRSFPEVSCCQTDSDVGNDVEAGMCAMVRHQCETLSF